jgi:(p)ppGpp synthase/HD superfamily hydrolase
MEELKFTYTEEKEHILNAINHYIANERLELSQDWQSFLNTLIKELNGSKNNNNIQIEGREDYIESIFTGIISDYMNDRNAYNSAERKLYLNGFLYVNRKTMF